MPRIEAAGLFIKKRHGGHLNRNSYEPRWRRFREIEAAWSARMKANSRTERMTEVSPGPCQPCHMGGDRPVTQTCRSNLSKETCQESLPKKELGRSVESCLGSERSDPSSKPSSPAQVAAERRWTTDLHDRFAPLPLTYGEVIQAVDQAMRIAATEAEMRSRGAGLAHILRKLKIPDRR